MPEYRRLISYIYEYEGKEKGKNVGFVKLEARNGQCRFNVNIKRMYVGANATGVYLLSKQGESVFLGNMFVRGGGGEFRITVDAENVEGSGSGLEGFFGLTVHEVGNSWRSYRTVWEDAEVPEEEIAQSAEVARSEAVDQRAEAAHREAAVQSAEIAHRAELREEEILQGQEPQEQSLQEYKQEFQPDSHPAPAQGYEPEYHTEYISGQTTERPVKSPELEDPDLLRYLQETEEEAVDPELLWAELRKSCPKIRPFDYDGESEVLTIRPQDIGKLPRENWVYGNNSFLLHGYYNFRYLILVRLDNSGGKTRYLLGVPGHYYSNEKYMANMFGFPNFVLSKKQPPNDGRFGYWYTDMKLG